MALHELAQLNYTESSVMYRTVTGHLDARFALPGAGQFDGQGVHHSNQSPEPTVRNRNLSSSAGILSGAST